MEFKEELVGVLHQFNFQDLTIDLDVTPEGMVGGFLISSSFVGISHIERQNILWENLEKALKEEERQKILSILTMTPDEVEEADNYP